MVKSSITVKPTKQTTRWLKQLEAELGRNTFNQAVLPFLDRHAKIAAGQISAKKLAGQRLRRRTGNLARSVVGHGVIERGRIPSMRVGVFRSAAPYAGIQERGGTIRPKRGKALAIPMDAAKTPAGVEKFGGPRNYPGKLTFIPFRGSGVAVGGLFLPEPLESSASLADAVMMYLLVREVTIKPKWYMRDGFMEYLPRVADALGPFLASLITKTKRERRR